MSDTMSARSNGSRNGGSKYRTVNNGGVDESLFGSKKPSPRTLPNNTISKKDLPSSSIVISSSQYSQMLNRSILLTPSQEESNRHLAELARHDKEQVSRLRKSRMIKLESESRSHAKKSASEEISDAKKTAIRKAAMDKIDQSNDLVKLLNTYSQRAMAFTIRDEQIKDKARRELMNDDYDRRLDCTMEIDRLKELESRGNSEKIKREKRLDDREVIIDQINARKKLKLLDEEKKESESRQMLATIQKYKDEDDKAAGRRAKGVASSREEVINANRAAILQKQERKEKEKEEVEMIMAYQSAQDAKMRAREEGEAERKRLVNERQKKMLDNQTRTQGKQAEVDELRARRAMEEGERRERQKELWKAKKEKDMQAELSVARRSQAQEKAQRAAFKVTEKAQEYESAVKFAYEMAERERREKEAKEEKNAEFREILQGQITRLEEGRALHRNDKQEEGKAIKKEMAAERIKLFAIRDKMVGDMKEKGISEKYLTEMMNIDIAKLQMR